MQLHFDRYKDTTGRLQWTSVAFLISGSVAILLGTFCGWIGLLMLVMTDGGLWERRAGVFLSIFTGLFPLIIGALFIRSGFLRRKELRLLRELSALARQQPAFTTDDVARVLDVGQAQAHRLVLDTLTKGILIDVPNAMQGPPPPPAPPPFPQPQYGQPPHVVQPTASGVQPGSGPHAPTVLGSTPPVSGFAPTQIAAAGAAANALIGTVLHGTYQIDSHLGEGGMGMVFRGRHLRTGRAYAIKTMLPDARFLPDARSRFEREATAASALGHPNIIGVHDFNETPDGIFYLVMDLLLGDTLEQRLARVGSLPWADARRIVLELGAGLAAAHAHGLLHRDVKPGNVLLAKSVDNTERAVLLDFGLVKPIDENAISRITATGAAVGTPLYMSPEQARGEPIDPRSDLYSLGALLFETVTGAPPFLDRTLANVYARLLTVDAPTASSVADHPIPIELDAVLARTLSKSREARFPDVKSFLAAIEAIDPETAPLTKRMVS